MTKRWSMLVAICCVVLASTAGVSQAQTASAANTDSTAVKKTASKTTKTVKGIRTIDAINIEGEIAVPQVLFITSRDNRRYRDGLGKNFRVSTLDVARSITIPNRLCVAGSQGPKSPASLKEE